MSFKRTRNLIILSISLILIGVFVFTKNNNNVISEVDEVSKEDISNFSVVIEYSSKYNYRQTINDCGPFSAAAVVRILTKNNVKSEDFVKDMKFRLPNKYTLPEGVEKLLKDNSIEVKTPNVKELSDEDKIKFIKEQLSFGKPVIILGERKKYEHYLTILGFDNSKDEFYIYDSFYNKAEEGLTIDNNGDLPGNRNYSSKELLNFWRGGGMYGLYEWYIIVADKK